MREETKKGFYGRLKQGFYPIQAPIGYLDQGKAKAKTIDPNKGPLVRKAFELYGTGEYSLETLAEEMTRLGLRTRRGKIVSVTALSLMLNNPFYIGIMRIWKTAEHFPGLHEPLISHAVFTGVQGILAGKFFRSTNRHEFLFRRLLTCAHCRYSLIGERQKGHIYYRCQTKQCPTKSVREEAVETSLLEYLAKVNLNSSELAFLKSKLLELRKARDADKETRRKAIKLQLEQTKDRLSRLTDAFLDGSVEKELYTERKNELVQEQKRLEASISDFGAQDEAEIGEVEKNLELAGMALLSYKTGNAEEKRKMIKIFTSNRTVAGKNVMFEPSVPFRDIANRPENQCCGPNRGGPRTFRTF